MAHLIFDGNEKRLKLFDGQGEVIEEWSAYNNTDSTQSMMSYIPNGDYSFMHDDRDKPSTHGDETDDGIKKDSPNGAFGSYGVFRLNPVHRGGIQIGHPEAPLGIHSGRADDGGPLHPTLGCIRTVDSAMGKISELVKSDPLTALIVRNNGTISGAVNAKYKPDRAVVVHHY